MSKRHTADEIASKLERARALRAQGKPVSVLSNDLGVTTTTYRRWRRSFEGLEGLEIQLVQKLERENAQLRRRLADLGARRALSVYH
ncbi:transposase [alpha proteobacterium U9-1i]|nr:transposase [alpha proteobacterium U9-1i]